jgi:hypothetical protein
VLLVLRVSGTQLAQDSQLCLGGLVHGLVGPVGQAGDAIQCKAISMM